MMRYYKWFLALLLMLFAINTWGACSNCTSSSASCTANTSSADVNTCLGTLPDDATVTFGSGSGTWTTTVNLPTDADITMVGDGKSSTTITCSSTCLLIPNSRTTDVSGFGFTSSADAIVTVRVDAAISTEHVRLHNNSFTRSGASFGSIDILGEPTTNCNGTSQVHPSVLIDNNDFDDIRVFSGGTACSFGDGSAQHRIWSFDPKPDAPRGVWPLVVYIEDNTFTADGGAINCTDANYSGIYVARFNTFTATAGNNRCYLEWHGEQGGNRGSPWKEVYNNSWLDAGNDNFFGMAFIRSGTGVFFDNNSASSTTQDMRLDNQRSWEDPGNGQCDGSQSIDGNTQPEATYEGWPCRDQIGRVQDDSFTGDETADQSGTPLYFWGNTKGTSTQYDPVLNNTDGFMTLHIVEDRDYYDEDSSFDGTSGVGVGTLASRPSTCTTGVGYWATDGARNWNKSNAGTNDGTLYKCTATDTWTEYYYPYDYPHPLRNEADQTQFGDSDRGVSFSYFREFIIAGIGLGLLGGLYYASSLIRPRGCRGYWI